MQSDDGHVLLTSLLLGLHQTGGPVEANDQAAGDFRVQCARMAGFFHSEDLLDPSDDFVGRGIGRLIKVDDTVFEVFRERSTDRGGGHWNRGVMRSSNIQLVIILQ